MDKADLLHVFEVASTQWNASVGGMQQEDKETGRPESGAIAPLECTLDRCVASEMPVTAGERCSPRMEESDGPLRSTLSPPVLKAHPSPAAAPVCVSSEASHSPAVLVAEVAARIIQLLNHYLLPLCSNDENSDDANSTSGVDSSDCAVYSEKELRFLLKPSLWKSTLLAMETRRMHFLSADEFVCLCQIISQFIRKQVNPQNKIEGELLHAFHLVDPLGGEKINKHTLMAAAQHPEVLTQIGDQCPYLQPIAIANVWTQTFIGRFMDHKLDTDVTFEEFRALVLDSVPRQEVAHKKAKIALKEQERADERNRKEAAERLRIANLPTVETEVTNLWNRLVDNYHREQTNPAKSGRSRLPKRTVMMQLKDLDGPIVPHLQTTAHLECLLQPKHWIKTFYTLKTRQPRDLHESEFADFCLEAIAIAKQLAPREATNESTGEDGSIECKAEGNSGSANAANGGRTDSETARTLQALKEDWLLQQELQR